MSENSNSDLRLNFFLNNGFENRKCTSCKGYFWTLSHERKTCGDPECDSYSFIGIKTTLEEFDMDRMRSAFVDFFRGTHGFVKPYPVVPRWRTDVLLVNASIYDFQPHVTSGRVEPPSNPLVMSQPSIRMLDIDLVGNTGRHLTSFEMMCHDAFNSATKQVYWKEETVEYCFRFLTARLGIEPDLITFKEKPWSGGGNGGNALEVFIRGVEVATLVFMDMIEDPDGDFQIDGKNYRRMEMRIVDTGYGLERLVWLSRGTSTIYQAVFPEVLHFVSEKAGIKLDNTLLKRVSEISAVMDPFSESLLLGKLREEFPGDQHSVVEKYSIYRDIFSLCDHAKTITILLSNYVIPSNVKVGYLLRLLIRRSQYLIEKLGIDASIRDLIDLHSKSMAGIIPDLDRKFVESILGIEDQKYTDLKERGKGIILRMLDRRKTIGDDDFVYLYDSEGINPEFVQRVVKEERGISIAIPENVRQMVISRHENSGKKRENKSSEIYPDIYTRPLYYDDTSIREFNSIVLYSGDKKIITNQTAFYPEGGGQPSDTGEFIYHGKSVKMIKAEKHGKSVVHNLSSDIPVDSRIIGRIDYDRRLRHMVHHSATHLLLGILIRELGPHVWQTGVQKGYDVSRIDFTHYGKLSEDEVLRIEKAVFSAITESHRITVKNIEWNRAISRYGFRLFEGGVPDGEKIRVVEIDGIDAEGCGGTHLKNTSEIGFFKILKVEGIQEGILRITFCAGPAAFDYVHRISESMQAVSAALGKPAEMLPESVDGILKENISLKKEIQEMIRKESMKALNDAARSTIGGAPFLIVEVSDERVEEFIGKYIFSNRKEAAIVIDSAKQTVSVYSPSGNADMALSALTFALGTLDATTKSSRVMRFNVEKAIDANLIRKNLVEFGSQGAK